MTAKAQDALRDLRRRWDNADPTGEFRENRSGPHLKVTVTLTGGPEEVREWMARIGGDAGIGPRPASSTNA